MINYLEASTREKEAGNKYWKENDFLNAGKAYSKALIAVENILKERKPETEKQLEEIIKNIQLPCLLNLSACYLKHNNGYRRVITFCTNALEIDKVNIKALYRRAIAYTYLDCFEEARADIKEGFSIDPNNEGLIKAQETLIKRETDYKERTKKIARKFLNRSPSPGSNTSDSNKKKEEATWWDYFICRRKAKN